jgi:hypothetical protein
MSHFAFVEHCERGGSKVFWARFVMAESAALATKKITGSFASDPWRKGCHLVRLEEAGSADTYDEIYAMYQKACEKAERLNRKP